MKQKLTSCVYEEDGRRGTGDGENVDGVRNPTLKNRSSKYENQNFACLVFLLVVTLPLTVGSAERDIGVRATQPTAGNAFYGNSWAVLIGINDYQQTGVRDLRYAVNDVTAIESALLEQGFERNRIFKLINDQATKAHIESLLADELRHKVRSDDRVLVFFAGHGKTERLRSGIDEGYLVPVNGNPDRLFSTAISMEALRSISERIPAKHILYIVDACYSGYAIYQRSLTSSLLDEMLRRPSIQILTAGRHQDQAQEKGGYGIFTHVLVRGLRGDAFSGKNWLALEELGVWLKQRVWAESGKRQLPQFGNLSGEGQFVFMNPRGIHTDPLPAPSSEPRNFVTTLLERADGQILRNRLTTPPGDNAYETLEQALQLAPGHPEALRRLRLIVERYEAWARASIESGQWERAAGFLARARRIAGDDREIEELMVAVTRARREARTSKRRAKTALPSAARSPAYRKQGMILVPAGWFFMGCNERVDTECKDDERPGRRVYLNSFEIDAFEVTAADYRRCVALGGCSTDGLSAYPLCNWRTPHHERHPINCASWYQAKTYCEWMGKRLPAEAEWEKAMRGTDGRKYPWGNQWSSNRANVSAGAFPGTMTVGSYPLGQSPYGARDMAGNVSEWVQDTYDSYPGHLRWNVTANAGRPAHVLRGGSWKDAPWDTRSSSRRAVNPGRGNVYSGFRCAR